MPNIARISVVMATHVTLFTIAFLLGSATPTLAQRPSVTPPSWLAGCWRGQSRGSIIEEQWMAPRGRVMLGASRTARGDSVQSYEFTRIYVKGDTLVYAASPSGQTPAEFRTTEPRAAEIVFENAAHDFPQRIVYRRIRPDSLAARIEGTMGGEMRAMSFGYRRVKCGV